MKRKSLLFLLLMAMFAPLAMNAQETLTVHDGTTTNDYVPVYGWYADAYLKCQMVYPAEELSAMNGKNITSLKFYTSQTSVSLDGTFQVWLMETRDASLSAFVSTDDATLVYEGTVGVTGSAMTISFNGDDFTYAGGNLLIGVYQTVKSSSYPTTTFYGETVSGASVQGYSYSDLASISPTQRNFLPKTTFTYETPSDCPKPTNFVVTYEGGTTATVTWEGNASSYNIDVNGTVTEGVTSPYTLINLEAATSYTVMVQADCGDEQSAWTGAQSFFTDCEAFDLPYAYGFETDDINCWTGGSMNTANSIGITDQIAHDGSNSFLFSSYSNASDYNQYLISPELNTTSAILVSFYYNRPSSYGNESFKVGYSTTTKDISAFTWEYDIVETTVTDWTLFEETMPAGTKYVAINYYSDYQYYLVVDDFTFEVSTGCLKPSGLEATNIGTNSAVLNWTGDNDSYVLQYRTGAHDNIDLWEQVGNDIIATANLTKYTFDLSEYSGTGNIAIRHYNISDMFRLAIDDVVVTDAGGQELVNETFEGGSIPSSWTNYDLDGDGYGWAAISFESQVGNGAYVAVSDSWNQSVGALTPDNWLIIPDVALGGTLTFWAVGVDANFPQENFGVFVTTESLETVFADEPAGEWSADITTTANTYELTGLEANMPYEWRVKGICGADETTWVTSTFTTIAEGFKTFITAGNWNVADNWFPAGVPTIDDEVSIEAAATIPAGVVATAKRADLNGGSILIKDGGQLKQGAATLRVTMEKEITGYGESDGNYYFIASPFSGRTLYQVSGTWSRVDNLFAGEYDFYAFDPTQELEWINYKANPSHISFESENGNTGLMYGEGYLYANQDGTTLNFVGTTGKSIEYSETIDYTFDAESTDEWNGWKLVGNYFSCNAYINYVDAAGNVLPADFYTLNNNNTYTLSSSNIALAPLTGALINYSATGKVQYATEAPSKAVRNGMINMNVSRNGKNLSQARLRFGQGHNLGSLNFRNGSRLYMNVEGNDYAVVYTENQGEMPVSFRAAENGTYTLSFNTEDVELGYLHLIDNMTGTETDLLSNPSYSFEAKTTDYASRFRLVFATGNADDNFAFFSNGNFVINNEGNATVQVIDVNGRIINSETINGCANVNVKAAAGVYMIRLVNGDNVKVQKVVVK